MNAKLPIAVLLGGDVLFSVTAVCAGMAVRYGQISVLKTLVPSDGVRLLLFALVTVFSSYFVELYNHEKNIGKREIFIRTGIALVISFFLLSSIYYLIPSVMFGRAVLMLSLILFGTLQFAWRSHYQTFINLPGLARRVLILGTGPLAQQIGGILSSSGHNYVLTGYVNCASEPVYVPPNAIVGTGEGLAETAKKERAHKIIISLSERREVFPFRDVLNCKFNGIEVVDAPSFYEQMTGKLLIENIVPSWFIFSSGFRITSYIRVSKRLFDIAFSIIGLLVAVPLFPMIALMIKLDSKGPVLFRQLRVGQGERDFVLYKFRTMRRDAERATGAVWAQENDPRVTGIGRFLRKSRLDELPQLYNVLRGDMAFVGPRPERPEFVAQLKRIIPYYSERHSVKPGVTGWAQVKYPYGASVEDAIEKLRYDLFYIKNISLFLDIAIIFETVKVVLFGRGGR